jgi:signal transduction histidine kinase
MSVLVPPHRHILVHAREDGDRSRMAAILDALGVGARELNELTDDELHAPSYGPVLAQTGGPNCPLDRLLNVPADVATSPLNGRPLILTATAQELPAVVTRTQRRSHAIVLAEPFFEAELASVLRASLAVEARAREACTLADRLREANEELERHRRQSEEDASRRTRFLAAISHDLRTPIWEIALFAQVVQNAASEPTDATDWNRLADGLLAGVSTLRERVDDLFDLARLDLGAIRPEDAAFLVLPSIEKAVAPLREEGRSRGVGLVVEVEPPWAEIVSDVAKVTRIVQNLASNAVKFTDVGEVRVTAVPEGPHGIAIIVRDSGRGIAPEAQSAIFDEFAQIHNPERDPLKGTGLGLAITSRLVKLLGGSIEVRSAPGHGSTFTVHLPCCVQPISRGSRASP